MDNIKTENLYPSQTLSLSQRIQNSLAQSEGITLTNQKINASILEPFEAQNTYGLESIGLKNLGHVYHNLSVPQLIEHALVVCQELIDG